MKLTRNIALTCFLILSICIAVTYTACTRDHCNSVVCLNGGACNGGDCTCLPGFEGNRCATLSRDKFIYTFNGGDTCSNHDTVYTQYPIHILAIIANPRLMILKGILNNINDSAVCTLQSVDSFSFIGSNNSTTYTGSGTLLHDTLKLYYHVQQDTFSYNCAYLGSIHL